MTWVKGRSAYFVLGAASCLAASTGFAFGVIHFNGAVLGHSVAYLLGIAHHYNLQMVQIDILLAIRCTVSASTLASSSE